MARFLGLVKSFFRSRLGRKEEGATLAEYGLLLALIAVVCLTAIQLLGTKLSALYRTVASSI
jgi:pilus assembly protein Flp/PilA